jgi:hypothetical protein
MKRKLIFISLLFVAIAAMAETSLIIQPLAGEEQSTAISTIGYIKMTPESLYVYSHSDLLLSQTAIKDINYLHFWKSENATNFENVQATTSCRVYPNPTQDMLIIDNANCDKAFIFDINGHLLQTISIDRVQTSINVNSLPLGEYLLFLSNQTVKFLKQ